MDFSFTDEQRMIRDTAQSFFQQASTSDAVRKAMETEQGYSDELWQSVCQEMFFQAVHIPESYGGMGLGYVELCSVVEQMGSNLVCSPFFSTVCLGANAILFAANDEQKEHYLPQIIDGSTATLAYAGRQVGTTASWGHDCIELCFTETNGQVVLDGQCHYVANGHTAQLIVVAAKEALTGELALFIVEPATVSTTLTRTYQGTMDQTQKQAMLSFNQCQLASDALMSRGFQAHQALEKTIALAQIAISADQLGGAQRVLDETVTYVNERVQFNRPVGSFQAVKHKAADMMLKAEASCSAVYYAACVADNTLAGQANIEQLQEAANIAKGYCSDAYFFNAGCAIQLFGGVGFTWEYDVHLYFKRAQSSAVMFGNSAYHHEQIASRLLD